MDIKKFITLENGVKIGLGLLSVGSLLLSSKKEKIDMQNLKADVVDDVLAKLQDQNK